MRKLLFSILCLTVFITALPYKGYSNNQQLDEELKLYIGEAQTVSVSSPKRVAVGNPSIADVGNIGKNGLTINPKSAGSTTLIIWDNFGEQSYRLKVFTEDTSKLKRRIDDLLTTLNLPDVYTKASDEEGQVILLGSVKLAKDKEKISMALGALKSKILDLVSVKEEEAVIEIDVQVIELNTGSRENLGLEWPQSLSLTEVPSAAVTPSTIGVTSFAKLFKIAGMTHDAFDLKLNFLVHEGKARILSRPRLSCQSGKEAKLQVGGEVPIISGTPATTGTAGTGSVEYKEYGIILNVKPQLTDSGRIHLNLDVEVSEVDMLSPISTDYAKAYPFTKRSATTELFLDDNQTMAIGGLIKQKSSEELKRVPWLSNIPVLGAFFRQRVTADGSNSDQTFADNTELFITLTPHLVDQSTKVQNEVKPLKIDNNIPSINDDKITDPVLKYSKLVQKAILDRIIYPASAKEAGFQGVVKLSLKLSPQGNLLDAKIKEPSSYRILDEAAVKTAQENSPYPPFPPAIKDKEVWVDIPIIYQLE